MESARPDADTWSDPTYDVLRRCGVRHVVHVPDAGLSRLIDRAAADDGVENVVLTTEQEGIGYLCGVWLGGQRGVLLMQSSGVGNCVNTLGLVHSGRFPFLTMVTMRGEWAEFNPWQVPMGQACARVLEAMGVTVQRADRPEDVPEIVGAAAEQVFAGEQAVAVLLSQRLIGRKVWTR